MEINCETIAWYTRTNLLVLISALIYISTFLFIQTKFPESLEPTSPTTKYAPVRGHILELCRHCHSCMYPKRLVWSIVPPAPDQSNPELVSLFRNLSDSLNGFCEACEATKRAFDDGTWCHKQTTVIDKYWT